MFFFMVSLTALLKKNNSGDMKNSKKLEKCSENVIIFNSNLNCIFGLENIEIWISLFL